MNYSQQRHWPRRLKFLKVNFSCKISLEYLDITQKIQHPKRFAFCICNCRELHYLKSDLKGIVFGAKAPGWLWPNWLVYVVCNALRCSRRTRCAPRCSAGRARIRESHRVPRVESRKTLFVKISVHALRVSAGSLGRAQAEIFIYRCAHIVCGPLLCTTCMHMTP